MVVPPVLAFRQVRSVGIEVVAGLGQDRDALFGEFSQPVHGASAGSRGRPPLRRRPRTPPRRSRACPRPAAPGCEWLRTRTGPLPSASLPRPSCSMRCWMRASSGAPTTTTLSRGELGHRGLHFFRRLVLDGGLAGNQHDDLADAAHLLQRVEAPASSPGCDMGVMWSYVVRMLPPSLRRRAETNVGMTITGFMRVLLPDFAFGLTGLL